MLLPNLPLSFQSLEALSGIANTIGHFISLDTQSLHSFGKRFAKLLVEMDILDGLPTDLELD